MGDVGSSIERRCDPRRTFVAVLLILALIACNRDGAASGQHFIVQPTLRGSRQIGEVAVGRGIACWVNGTVGTASYSVADIGKSGVPALTRDERTVAAKIRHYMRSPLLRFAFVGGEFIVFDAVQGPCGGSVYDVLNGHCEEYSPTDNLGYTTAASVEGCRGTPPPWM